MEFRPIRIKKKVETTKQEPKESKDAEKKWYFQMKVVIKSLAPKAVSSTQSKSIKHQRSGFSSD